MRPLLLIHPSNRVFGGNDLNHSRETLTPSLGLGYLAAYARSQGIDVRIIDLRLPHRSLEDVTADVTTRHPLIGITAFTNEIVAAGRTAAAIRQRVPTASIIVGGPHATALPERTLAEFPDFDLAVIGEGEETLTELCQRSTADWSSIPGICMRRPRQAGARRTTVRAHVANLDALPFPAWDLFELDRYSGPLMIAASRGCPYPCAFCFPSYLGPPRTRAPQRVAEEMAWAHRTFGARHFQFADATLSLLQDKVAELCDRLQQTGLAHSITWDCETRADRVTPQLLQKMAAAGCSWIALGVETGNPRLLRSAIGKGETIPQIRQAVTWIRHAGIKVRCFFTFGHAGETSRTIRQTIKLAVSLAPDAVSFGLMVPNPGSRVRQWAEQGKHGLRILHNQWEYYDQLHYSCFETDSLSLQELKRWQAAAYFLFYLFYPRKALAILNDASGYGYTPQALLTIPFKLLNQLCGFCPPTR